MAMMLVTPLFGLAALLPGVVHPSNARGASRIGSLRMMPKATPRVPYKYPGMQDPSWIDVYNRMYRERIMFLKQGINDDFANTIIAVLLYLESEDANSPVAMYCNIGGGTTKAGLAIYDTMRIMPFDLQTVNLGVCAQVGAFIVGGGTKGKRFALPNSRFAMMNPGIQPSYDQKGNPIYRRMQATEMQLEVEEVLRDKERLLRGFSGFTGRPIDALKSDFKRDFYLDADEALAYGLIDEKLKPKRPSKLSSDVGLGATVGLG